MCSTKKKEEDFDPRDDEGPVPVTGENALGEYHESDECRNCCICNAGIFSAEGKTISTESDNVILAEGIYPVYPVLLLPEGIFSFPLIRSNPFR